MEKIPTPKQKEELRIPDGDLTAADRQELRGVLAQLGIDLNNVANDHRALDEGSPMEPEGDEFKEAA